MTMRPLLMGSGALVLVGLGVLLWPGVGHTPTTPVVHENAGTGETVRILFVGDIMLDRLVAVHARREGDAVLFDGVAELLRAADIVVGNLEGSITTFPSVAERDPKILRFTFDPRFARALKDAGFDALSLANNHALDFGVEGYAQTVGFLQDAGIAPFGHPLNTESLSTSVAVGSTVVCFLGYHSLFDPDSAWVVAELKRLRPLCSYMVVMAHWGEEYQHEPTAHQRAMAHTFVDLGADMVVGAHPHVVQPVEIYNNRAIFYSLGNFIFDQNFQSEVRRGVALQVHFASSTARFTAFPVTTYLTVRSGDASTTAAVLTDLGLTEPSFELQM